MVSSAIEPLLWTPCWHFCFRALFNDPLAATLIAHLLPLDLDALWLDVELSVLPSVSVIPDDPFNSS
jgi:hypothetical protein